MEFLDSRELVIPRGKAYFHPYLSGTQTPAGGVDLGNVPELTLTPAVETKAHYSSQTELRRKDRELVISQEYSGAFTTDDMLNTTRALWLMATETAVTATSLTAQTDTFKSAKPGETFQVGRSTTNPTGARKITVTTLMKGATPLVLGTDYLANTDLGLITILSTSTVANGTDLTLTYNVAISTRARLASAQVQPIEGELKIIADNPAGENIDYTIPRVQLKPSGDLALMQDPESTDWQKLSMSISVLKKGNLAYVYADGRPV